VHSEIAWLHRQLPRLIAEGVLTEEAADALRRHYGPPEPRRTRARWGQILLAAFGALLVGGGVILILAHNWDILGRPARAALALGLLLAAQILTLFALVRRPHSAAWTEATSVFLVAACGASLALVGQTYHLGGSFEDLMQAWLWLVVLVPYLTGSTLAAIGFWGLLVIRITALGWRDAPWDPWLLVLAGTPFVLLRVRARPESWSTALVTAAAAASTFVVGSMVTIQGGWNGLWAVFQLSLLGALIAAAVWEADGEIAGTWRGRILAPAWIGAVLVGTALTFDDPWRSASSIQTELRNPNVAGAAVVALACAVFASIVTIRLARVGRRAAAIATAAPFLVVATHALALSGMDAPGWVVFNLWLLAVGSLTLMEGIRALKLGTANRGLFALSLLLLARFFDSDQSFLARGLAFVVLGSACLALNYWLMRRARTEAS
jgi:uncharacterized membrane protein